MLVDGRPHFPQPAPDAGGERTGRPPPNSEVVVPPGTKRIVVNYTAISFVRAAQTRFRTQLEGAQPTWEEAGTARTVQYSELRPGRYLFRVTARSPESDWLPDPAAMALQVQPFYWQTWWFATAAYAAGALLLAGLVRWILSRRFRRRLAELERQRQLEAERTRIARDLHDDLGSSLTQIAYWSDLVRRQGQTANPTPALQRIAETAREAVRGLDQIVWILKHKNDSLDHLANYLAHFADEHFAGHPTRCRLELPPSLPDLPLTLEVRRSLFLAAKEALTNVLKHAQATEATLRLCLTDGDVRLTIEDNGRGFDPALVQSGNGLEHLNRRMAGIGGACQVTSQPGAGTIVRLDWPLPKGQGGQAAS